MAKKPIIIVSDLTKRFQDLVAVNNISFKVNEGEIFAFLGPNGAGKSTTIKMLTTLLKPTSGGMVVNGFDPQKQQDRVRDSFGIVFQDPSIDEELTAMENMKLHAALYDIPKDKEDQRIKTMMTMVDLWNRKDDFVKTFSGGMRRRLEIARGLLHHPRILFLDEPTLGLDPQTRSHIWDYIRKVNKNDDMTVFFTTHYMEEAEKVANRVAVINNGIISAIGTVDQLEKQTKTKTLEDAFLDLTGTEIREEMAGSLDRLRQRRRMMGGRR
jgi:ABC-2 type transport system ATP-binding protein